MRPYSWLIWRETRERRVQILDWRWTDQPAGEWEARILLWGREHVVPGSELRRLTDDVQESISYPNGTDPNWGRK